MLEFRNKDLDSMQAHECVLCTRCVTPAFLRQFDSAYSSEHTIRLETEFQHLYTEKSRTAISRMERRQPSRARAVAIINDWQFDIEGADSESPSWIRARLPECTNAVQADRRPILSRELDGDVVTVTAGSEPFTPGRARRQMHADLAPGRLQGCVPERNRQ